MDRAAVAESEQEAGGGLNLRDVLPVGMPLRGYLVEDVLGYGEYDVVYRARREELHHSVAIKEYSPAEFSVHEGGAVRPGSTDSLAPYEVGRRRFLEETKRIVKFNDDPGVVAFPACFRANGTAYLVMESVDGLSLSQLPAARESAGSPLTEAEPRLLIDPLLSTLRRLDAEDVLQRGMGQPLQLSCIDAFAGCSKITTRNANKGADEFVRGSAERTVRVSDKPFDRLIVIDRAPERCAWLNALRNNNSDRDTTVVEADSNEHLDCVSMPSRTHGVDSTGGRPFEPFFCAGNPIARGIRCSHDIAGHVLQEI